MVSLQVCWAIDRRGAGGSHFPSISQSQLQALEISIPAVSILTGTPKMAPDPFLGLMLPLAP